MFYFERGPHYHSECPGANFQANKVLLVPPEVHAPLDLLADLLGRVGAPRHYGKCGGVVSSCGCFHSEGLR